MVAPVAPVSSEDGSAPDYKERPELGGGAGDDDPPGFADGSAGPFEVRGTRVGSDLHGQRLDKALVRLAPEFSRSHLQSLVERGHVRIDGEAASSAARKLRAGQQLQLELVPTDESRAFTAQAMALDIVFEDAQLMVLNKPAGLVVHPAAGNWSGTLLNGLLAHHAGAAALPRAGIVHRLDKDTSGLMVVGKTLPAVTALSRAIAAREVQRHYLALVHGVPAAAEQTIDAPIGRDPVSRIRMAVIAGGRPARTDVRCVASRGGISAMACTLHTGRTHQIRVHLAARGHALVADALYGGAPALGMTRQALHAARLRLRHPQTSRWFEFDCPLPADMAAAWASVAPPSCRA
jgi:23S rRNA pseudouridine1911/1915/1917 synthase